MTLTLAGRAAAASALSGYAGLLAEQAEADLDRVPVTFRPGEPVRVSFGPARKPARVTGVAVYQHGVLILTRPFEPRTVTAGQSLQLTVTLDAEVA